MRTKGTTDDLPGWRRRLHEIVFESDTRAGKTFDLVLLVSILTSVVVVVLESMPRFRMAYGRELLLLEWGFTLLFTIEYILRLLCIQRPLRYARSFFGLVDLFSFAPTYLSLLIPGAQYFLVIRLVRLLRIFRILKMAAYLSEGTDLSRAIWATRRKISVFLLTVMTLMVIIGALIYVIEGEAHGFTDIPTSIYWAVVTLTTVGYGDLAPKTGLGKLFATLVMLLGYGIIAVPTGIVTMELNRTATREVSVQACPVCSKEGHDIDAVYCKFCAGKL